MRRFDQQVARSRHDTHTGGKHRVTQSHTVVTHVVVVRDTPSLVSSWMHPSEFNSGWLGLGKAGIAEKLGRLDSRPQKGFREQQSGLRVGGGGVGSRCYFRVDR